MDINTKYDIGDIIVYKSLNRRYRKLQCGCCGGSGIINGLDGVEYECGECEGSGELVEEIEGPNYEVGSIKQIYITIEKDNPRIEYSTKYSGIYGTRIDERTIVASYPAGYSENIVYEDREWCLEERGWAGLKWVLIDGDD